MGERSPILLEVKHLRVAFRTEGGGLSVPVRDVSFTVPRRGRIALVGESGCGKSLTALALKGLVDRAEVSGEITGKPRISYIFQNPMQSLDPVMRIGRQIKEARYDIRDEGVLRVLSDVGLPPETVRKYPCQLSGGQQQRVMIAAAVAACPTLLVADEPTTALDVTTQKEILDLLVRVAPRRQMTILLITHNLGLVARYADFVHVMYAGEIVESGPVLDVLAHPRHPYTQGLLEAVPRLDAPKDAPLRSIKGTVPPPTAWPTGCAFHPRCPKARASCASPTFTICPYMKEETAISTADLL